MTDDKKLNPWRLTPRECQVLTALVDAGTSKAAAKQLGLQPKTVETLARLARDKMRAGNTLSRLQAAVLWDRWAREQRA